MVNKKGLRKVSAKDKKTVTGGSVYAGQNESKEMVFYVPHSKKGKSIEYKTEMKAKYDSRRILGDNEVYLYSSAAEAKKASDRALREMREKGQKLITDYFIAKK